VLASIALEPASLTLAVSDSTMVTGHATDQGGRFVPLIYTWTSSDTTRLAIRLPSTQRARGVRVVALAAGAVTLTASAEGINAAMNVIIN
jgi:hypothetical protein